MAIRILTDTTSDIAFSEQESLGIRILPLRIIFGDKEYIDGIDITKKEFYQKLAVCEKLPGTAQISPGEFYDCFKEYLNNGDELVCMFISSELSGTHNSALAAKDSLAGAGGERIHIVDTKNVTFGLGVIVLEAVRLRGMGYGAAELCAEMNRLSKTVRLWGVMDTLKYLKMNGRLSGTAAVVGTLLNIKPIVTIDEGKVISVAKMKGYKKGCDYVKDMMKKYPPDFSRSIVFASSDSPEILELVIADITGKYPEIKDYARLDIGAVVGAHIGPRCGGIAYFEKESG